MPALERRDRRPHADLGQVGKQRQDAAVDAAGLDVRAAAGVDLDPAVGKHAARDQRLRKQDRLADGQLASLLAGCSTLRPDGR